MGITLLALKFIGGPNTNNGQRANSFKSCVEQVIQIYIVKNKNNSDKAMFAWLVYLFNNLVNILHTLLIRTHLKSVNSVPAIRKLGSLC